MPNSRYIKIWYPKLLTLSQLSTIPSKQQIKYYLTTKLQICNIFFKKLILTLFRRTKILLSWKQKFPIIIIFYTNYLSNTDNTKIACSSYNPSFNLYFYYSNLISVNMPYNILKTIEQLRTARKELQTV